MKIFHLLTIVLVAGYGFCEITNDLDKDEVEKQLKEKFPELGNFNSSALPSQEDVEKLLKEKCEKNGGGEEAYNALKDQQAQLVECVQGQLNSTEIQAEIEESKKTGSMDEVFGKYCRKYPEIYKCVEGVVDKIKPCLEPVERDTMNKTLDIIAELKEFICFKDGDRIAMFIAEGGVECLESRKEQLQECSNKTLGSRIPTDVSLSNLPMLVFTDRECNDFDKLRVCFNEELEKCKDSTPANIVDAFFKFMKKQMPCKGVATASFSQEKEDAGSSSVAVTVSAIVVSFSVMLSKIL